MSRVRLRGLFQVCDEFAGEAYIERLKNSRKSSDKLYYLKHKFLGSEQSHRFLTIDYLGEFHTDDKHEFKHQICKFRSCDIEDIENMGFDLRNFEMVEEEGND